MKYKKFIKENKKQQIYFSQSEKRCCPTLRLSSSRDKFTSIKKKPQRDDALGNTFELVCCCYYYYDYDYDYDDYEVIHVNYGDDSQEKDGRRNPCVPTNVCTRGYVLCWIQNTKPGQRSITAVG